MTLAPASFLAIEASQPRAVQVLARMVRHGRLSHGIMVVGPASTPVQQMCQALAAFLLCREPCRTGASQSLAPGDGAELLACGKCSGCRLYSAGTHPSLTVVTGNERGTITVAQVRAASAKLHLHPRDGGLNIMCIHGAQGMQKGAQNALLKTLEEPPGQGCIIMGTTSVGLLLPTILSRVVRVVLAPPDKAASIDALTQGGIDSPYAELLAPQVGTNVALAQSMMEAGFVQVEGSLREALTAHMPVEQSHAIATRLAQNAQHFDMAVALLEVLLRDALAALGGVQQHLMTQPGVGNLLTQLPGPRISRAIDGLMLLRRQRKLNIHRAQALMGLFVTLNHRGTT